MILDMWSSDSVIGQSSLDESSRQTPVLHAKYLELLSLAKLRLKKAEQEQKCGLNRTGKLVFFKFKGWVE